ncbi:MAG: serine/threonine-protein kinase [Planctomycetota bacterium]|nr:MAG: serine/threonine-protein kinase [Planctomycetota bacterium]
MPLRSGKRIGEYILHEKLGNGAFGEVWKAEHNLTKDQFAIKFFTSDKAASYLRREAKILISLREVNHPNIVHVYGGNSEHEPPYIVMELVEGNSLAEILNKHEKLPVSSALKIFNNIVYGVAYAHMQGFVHRDLKPGNILIGVSKSEGKTKVDKVKICDFGLGDVIESEALALSGKLLSSEGKEVVGTLEYMAPEQLHGEKTDERSDVYSLGLILFKMLTGKLPSGMYDSVTRYLNEPISEKLDKLIQRCCAPPEERYENAAELLNDVEALSDAQKLAKKPPGQSERLPDISGEIQKPSKLRRIIGNKRYMIVGSSVLVALAVFLVVALLSTGNKNGRQSNTVNNTAVLVDEKKKRITALMQSASEKEKNGDYNGAIGDYTKVLAIKPDHVSALIKRGSCRIKTDNLDEAISDYTTVIDMNPSDESTARSREISLGRSYHHRGRYRYDRKDYPGAISDLTKAIEWCRKKVLAKSESTPAKIYTLIAEIYVYRAKSKLEVKDLSGTIEDCSEAIELEPNNVQALFYRGRAKMELKNFRGAISDYTKIIENNPDNKRKEDIRRIWLSQAFNNRGKCKTRIEDHYGAISDYSEAITQKTKDITELGVKPTGHFFAEAYLARGIEYVLLEKYKEGIKDYCKAIKLSPKNSTAYYYRGLAKNDMKDFKGAIADYTIAITHDPDKPYYYNFRAQARVQSTIISNRMSLTCLKDAIKDYDKAIALSISTNPRYYYFRAHAKSHCADVAKESEAYLDSAIVDYTIAIDNYKDTKLKAEAYCWRANTKCEKKDYLGAQTDINNALKLDPNNSFYYFERARFKSEAGDQHEAISDYNKALELDPTFAVAYWSRALIKSRMGDKKGAEADFKKAQDLGITWDYTKYLR